MKESTKNKNFKSLEAVEREREREREPHFIGK